MAFLVPLAAQAALQNGTFDSDFDATGLAFDTDDTKTQEVWLAGPSWARNSEGFAEKSDSGSDILLQGFALPEGTCIPNNWKVKVRFDYKNPNGEVSGKVKVLGFTSGTWSSADGTTTGEPVTLVEADLADTIVNEETGETEFATFQTCSTLTGDNSNFAFLAIGFDLPDPVTVGNNSAVDNVEVLLVAPVTLKLTPRTLNLKSKGNWVTVAVSNPPSCYSLTDIDTSTLELSVGSDCFGSDGFGPDWFKVLKNKVHAKFSRAELIEMLGTTTGQAVPVMVSGTFNDGVAFEGVTHIKVINPGKPKPPKNNPKGK